MIKNLADRNVDKKLIHLLRWSF